MHLAVLGADGQVGRAMRALLPESHALDKAALDITDEVALDAVDWSRYDAVVNAAGYTAVDAAQMDPGRTSAWRVNALGVASLVRMAQRHDVLLVHFSSDYVFDGAMVGGAPETAPTSPINWYGVSKAAGDIAVAAAPRHYLLRTSWVVGDGRNFVRTMIGLARRGVSPFVVADQVGRPTFADDLAIAARHLLATGAPYGTYNVTGSGEPGSWADIAATVFALVGEPGTRVIPVSTAAYRAGRPESAPRPPNSLLDLARAERAGIALPAWRERLTAYVTRELAI